MSGLPHVLCVVCHCVWRCVCPQVVCQVLKVPILPLPQFPLHTTLLQYYVAPSLLTLSLLSDKRPVLWGQLVLVFCTLLADLNALTSMAVALQSHAGFDSAPGLQACFPSSTPSVSAEAQWKHRWRTHTDTHRNTHSCKGLLILSLPVPAWANFSWVAAKIKAFIHPWLWEVKCGAGRSGLGWSATATLVWGVTVSCQPLVSVLF